MHDPSHPLYLPLRLLHLLGVVVFAGGLLTALWLKLRADRAGEPAFAARVHRALRTMDGHLIGPGALATFAGGYLMVRLLGGRIAHHMFVLWGLILMFLALALWYFGMRNLGTRLAEDAERSAQDGQPLSATYGRNSGLYVLAASGAVLLVLVTVALMVFKLPSA